jgi:hypothetical protein
MIIKQKITVFFLNIIFIIISVLISIACIALLIIFKSPLAIINPFFIIALIILFMACKFLKNFEYDEENKLIKFNGNICDLNDIKSIEFKKKFPYSEKIIIFNKNKEYWIYSVHFKDKDFKYMKKILEDIKLKK